MKKYYRRHPDHNADGRTAVERDLINRQNYGASQLRAALQTKKVLTVADVARLTGYSISTVYKLTSERKIPFHKPEHKGRKLYFNREEILDWLQSESHPTIEQENIQRINQLKKH